MQESEGRAAIVAAAISWLHTPYKQSARLRGVGANCATLIYGIALDAGVLPPDAQEPRFYTPQFHQHSRENRLIDYITAYGAVEIYETEVKPGDIVAYMSGQSYGHLGVIIEMPRKIVQTTSARGCEYAHLNDGVLAHCPKRYFTLWPAEMGSR
jgi:cell wall-associated NlpC family hydrolase